MFFFCSHNSIKEMIPRRCLVSLVIILYLYFGVIFEFTYAQTFSPLSGQIIGLNELLEVKILPNGTLVFEAGRR